MITRILLLLTSWWGCFGSVVLAHRKPWFFCYIILKVTDLLLEFKLSSYINICFELQVSKHDATKVQRELEGEMFDKFSEGCEVMNATKIPFSNLDSYLDYLQSAFKGKHICI